eukprot:scaffold7329_cov222-Pinguiococcus_pyrenoidosus.AAC.12
MCSIVGSSQKVARASQFFVLARCMPFCSLPPKCAARVFSLVASFGKDTSAEGWPVPASRNPQSIESPRQSLRSSSDRSRAYLILRRGDHRRRAGQLRQIRGFSGENTSSSMCRHYPGTPPGWNSGLRTKAPTNLKSVPGKMNDRNLSPYKIRAECVPFVLQVGVWRFCFLRRITEKNNCGK